MGNEIKYENASHEFISAEEAQHLSTYFKNYYIHGNLHKIESYQEGELVAFDFYLDENDNFESAAEKYANHKAKTCLVKTIETFCDYTLKEEHYYVDGNLIDKNLVVTTSDNLPICIQFLASDNSVEGTEKEYFDKNGDLVFSFQYDADNQLYSLFISETGKRYSPDQLDDSDVNFDWTGLDYYRNADPLLPEE